jgi:hypothetical protein
VACARGHKLREWMQFYIERVEGHGSALVEKSVCVVWRAVREC